MADPLSNFDVARAVPPGGGGTNQILAKVSGDDHDMTWVDQPAGPGPGTDTSAIHDSTAGEIAAVQEKTTPVSADLLLIEDSASSNAKKRVQVGNLPTPTVQAGDVDSESASDGYVLTADGAGGAAWEAGGGGGGTDPNVNAHKTAVTARTNTTTPADDPDLVVALAANTVYAFDCCICLESHSTPDTKFGFNAASGLTDATLIYHYDLDHAGATTFGFNANHTSAGAASYATRQWRCRGVIIVGTSAGSLAFEWSQQTSDAVNESRIGAGSWMTCRKL